MSGLNPYLYAGTAGVSTATSWLVTLACMSSSASLRASCALALAAGHQPTTCRLAAGTHQSIRAQAIRLQGLRLPLRCQRTPQQFQHQAQILHRHLPWGRGGRANGKAGPSQRSSRRAGSTSRRRPSTCSPAGCRFWLDSSVAASAVSTSSRRCGMTPTLAISASSDFAWAKRWHSSSWPGVAAKLWKTAPVVSCLRWPGRGRWRREPGRLTSRSRSTRRRGLP